MTNNHIKIGFPIIIVLILAELCFGQNPNVPTRFSNADLSAMGIQQPELPGKTTNASGINNPTNTVPSITDLKTLIDKAMTAEDKNKEWSTPVKLVIIFSGLAILPSLLVMMTSFTRIVIVLAFVRRALTTQTIPPTIAIMGLALFLTLYTMAPTFEKINANAVQPYLTDEIDFQTAGTIASNCIKEFMLRQSREADLALFVKMAKIEPPTSLMDIDMHIVIPAFIISEFRTAFEIGCLLFIPFLLLDMVIAGVLLSAGMMMLPPVMISLPFKLILFILVDGWGLLAKSISLSFN
jgi:flagellar biosynthetic protein FliP